MFFVLGVSGSYALAPPLATLLQKRTQITQDQQSLVPSAVPLNNNQEGQENAELTVEEGGPQGSEAGEQDEDQETQQQETEPEEPTGAESQQQFSVVSLQDLDTAATGQLGRLLLII